MASEIAPEAQKRAIDHLNNALETEEMVKKDYHLREAVQLLCISEN